MLQRFQTGHAWLELQSQKNCSHAGNGDLGVLTTHKISPYFSIGDVGSTRQVSKAMQPDALLGQLNTWLYTQITIEVYGQLSMHASWVFLRILDGVPIQPSSIHLVFGKVFLQALK